ncbi:12185_t:CDS:2, partial [Racocetra persica]
RRRIQGPEVSVAPIIIKSADKRTCLKDEHSRRHDGRNLEDICLISQANGSAFIEIRRTKIACGVYGPRQTKIPSFSGKGNLNVEIKFAPFSCQK